MKIALINPNLLVQRGDPFTTGIVYMPIGLAYVAAALRANGETVTVLDAFGENPEGAYREGRFYHFGLHPDEVVSRVPSNTQVIFLYANQLTNHLAILNILRRLKNRFQGVPKVVLENTQAVTAYALQPVAPEFYEAGADYILTGEGESRSARLCQALADGGRPEALRQVDGLGAPDFYTHPCGFLEDLDALSFPAWDLFPLDRYWKLRHSHGPFETSRYLPLLTSRGCPFPCRFCVIPETNRQRWRSRSPGNVADEMAALSSRFGVTEFHLEDLNPTISDPRIRALCAEILRRPLRVSWKIVAGTKAESIRNAETVKRMALAGCRYISISPETGSGRLLKRMDKPFDLRHALRIIGELHAHGIRSQACFVLGFPGETQEDRVLTQGLVRDLTRAGLDEIALFIVTPVPGSALYGEITGYKTLSELSFSPSWRADYRVLNHFRLGLYSRFLLWKLFYHPFKFTRQILNFVRRSFETKMEMAPYRALRVLSSSWRCKTL